MAIKFTDMQKKAIETRGNVLVSAAAGSGKTAVLVERVISMLTDKNSPVSADKLLIVTFTNAAAAEMRNRIEKRIYEEIQNNPNDDQLQKQKYLLKYADICTIDSFCIKLVRENFEKCGVEPDFKISDGSGNVTTCNKVMSQLISEYLQSPTKEFERLLELTGCEFDEKNLTELINRLYLYSQQLPFPKNFIDGLLKPYHTEFNQGNIWHDMAIGFAQRRIDDLMHYCKQMVSSAAYINKNTEKYIAYAENTEKIICETAGVLSQASWDKFASHLQGVSFERLPSCEKDDVNGNTFKENQKQVKAVFSELLEMFCSADEVKTVISQNSGAVELLVDMIKEYSDRLFAAFCEENTFTFYNMEQLALNLLCEYKDGEIVIRDEAQELCNKYDEVLVDEFQDVNDLQNTLFYVLSNREKNLFVVGDVKQSIYGFRGSNPDNFLNKKNRYVSIENSSENDPKKIILSDNFRSRKGVCDAVNYFFSCLMAGQCGSIVYDREEQLNAGGDFPESEAPTADVLVVDKSDESDVTLLELESKKIAEYIISVMSEGAVITDGKKLRSARYSDFAILLDKVKDKASVIAQTLSDYGIPVALSGDSFLESTEVSTVMSLLQVIDNPKCDVELLHTMMSPVFAFSAEEMAKIRALQKYGPLYSAVVAYSKTGDKKTTDFIQKLAQLRRDAAVLSIDRLISKLIHSTDILNMMSALSGGDVRRNNLFSLITYAKNFATHADSGIYGFIRHMKSLPENSFKSVGSVAESSVRIMSMHNSKGLQFPVCIVANLASQINNADSISRVLFSEKGGIAFKYYDEIAECDVEMLGHSVLANAAQIKTVEEKLRLLYVAMTRAIDRLCIVCSAKNLDSKLTKLSAALLDNLPYISREFLEKGRNMGDWILSCALIHNNGDVLRKYADIKLPTLQNDAKLNICIENGADNTNVETACANDEQHNDCDLLFVEKIKENFNYAYPYEELRRLQAKASVSRLVHSAEDDRFAFCNKPAFMLGDKLTGAGRGTAMHHIMQFINFEHNVNVDAEIERLLEWKFITEQEAASADISAIKVFFTDDIYRRIMQSNGIHREMRFLSEIPANKIDYTVDANANIIVQGAIDLCFEEDDSVVILDFKTDRVDNLSQLVECYGEQLDIYSAAAEKIFNKPVKEKIIYSFHLGKSISF